MSAIIAYFSVTPAEFWIGILLLALAFFVLLLAVRPEREYADLPRGVFPHSDERHPTREVTGGEAPLRTEPPEMSVAEASLVYRGVNSDDLMVATLVDLASRGFLKFVEYHHLPGATPAIIITYARGGDDTCSPEEHMLLTALSTPGSAESPRYTASRPFDARRYRMTLEENNIPPLGIPAARLAGIRTSLIEQFDEAIFTRVQSHRGWLRQGRRQFANAGTLEFLGGVVGAVIASVLAFTGALRPFWILIFALIALMGIVTVIGAGERTADGIVARDQVAGFRDFLVDAPRDDGATLEKFAAWAGWAVALDCVYEWSQCLERLSVGSDREVESFIPWANRTEAPYTEWHEIAELIENIGDRLGADPDADDKDAPAPR